MTTNTITAVSTEALDLRPALELKPRAIALTERLRAGDRTAIGEGRELVAEADAIVERLRASIEAHGVHGRINRDEEDAAWTVVYGIAVGDVDWLIDELESFASNVSGAS
jgi:hypothetical protein